MDMEYNSQKELLVIPEYGRNLQNLVSYAIQIEDKEKKQVFCDGLIKLMHQISPQTRNVDESLDRLWNHLMRISDYKLDVKIPDHVLIVEHDETVAKVKKMPYGKNNSKFRHYGQNIPKLIEKAIALEEGDKKQEFIEYITAFMKLVYRTWNQNHYINDDTIKSDLLTMSGNKLKFNDETMNIDLLSSHISFTPKKKSSTGSSNKKHQNNKKKPKNNNYKKKR